MCSPAASANRCSSAVVRKRCSVMPTVGRSVPWAGFTAMRLSATAVASTCRSTPTALCTDDAAAPVYDAKIRVHIAYGFMYLHKMDLEVGTNVDGKARFTGLPARTKDGLAFQASKADRAGTAFVDPSTTCKADLTVVLQKKMQ